MVFNMKKIILLILALCCFTLQSCIETNQEVSEYHLVYKVYYPDEPVTDTLVFYARGNNVPTYALRANKNVNILYVFGTDRSLNPNVIGYTGEVLSTTAPIRVVSFEKMN